jgi:hypothetical protein
MADSKASGWRSQAKTKVLMTLPDAKSDVEMNEMILKGSVLTGSFVSSCDELRDWSRERKKKFR